MRSCREETFSPETPSLLPLSVFLGFSVCSIVALQQYTFNKHTHTDASCDFTLREVELSFLCETQQVQTSFKRKGLSIHKHIDVGDVMSLSSCTAGHECEQLMCSYNL